MTPAEKRKRGGFRAGAFGETGAPAFVKTKCCLRAASSCRGGKAPTAQEAIMMDQILFWGGLAAAAIVCIAGAAFMAVWALRWKNLQFALEREYGPRPGKK